MTSTQNPGQRALAIQMQIAKSKYGVGHARQFLDLLWLCGGRAKLRPKEYYQYGLYRPELSKKEKAAFLGKNRNSAHMKKVNDPKLMNYELFVHDKLLFDALVSSLGHRSPELLAYAGQTDLGSVRTLQSKDQIASFLTTDVEFPIFCKPRFSSLGEGATQIDGVDRETGTITLGDTTTVAMSDFIDRVLTEHADGYLFQERVNQSPDLLEAFGQAPAILRYVTLKMPGESAEVFYLLLRLSKPDSMGVLEYTEGLHSAEIDPENGSVISDFWQVEGFFSTGLRSNTDTGMAREEIVIPAIDEMTRIAVDIHNHFQSIKILGFDFILSDRGPVVLEANSAPSNRAIQRLRDCGFFNPAFDARTASLPGR